MPNLINNAMQDIEREFNIDSRREKQSRVRSVS